jgi:hypothetical protein
MRRITIWLGNYRAVWAGGSFICVWFNRHAHDPVPDLMIELPASINRSKATRADIERVLKENLSS